MIFALYLVTPVTKMLVSTREMISKYYASPEIVSSSGTQVGPTFSFIHTRSGGGHWHNSYDIRELDTQVSTSDGSVEIMISHSKWQMYVTLSSGVESPDIQTILFGVYSDNRFTSLSHRRGFLGIMYHLVSNTWYGEDVSAYSRPGEAHLLKGSSAWWCVPYVITALLLLHSDTHYDLIC